MLYDAICALVTKCDSMSAQNNIQLKTNNKLMNGFGNTLSDLKMRFLDDQKDFKTHINQELE